LGISEAMTAGAVISGAYFGDKMSPLSDTTNLAPAMAGTDLFTHIRYMSLTTIPSIVISLVAFTILGWNAAGKVAVEQNDLIQEVIASHFQISLWLFLPPLVVVILIVRKVPAIPAVFAGTLMGLLCAVVFQADLLMSLKSGEGFKATYELMMNAVANGLSISTGNELVDELFSSSGMEGMLNTIWLILSAMVFGGAMEGAGLLHVISERLMRLARSEFALVGTTTATCVGLNVTASDQYLAIVVPGRMYAKAFKEKGLAPENLSRTLEDAGTVTSVLVPYNTCGAYQSSVLGVATGAYLPYAIFNWLSPIMTLIFSYFSIKIARRKALSTNG
jgi:NhaC family Na+:H+ antiporter